MLNDPKIYTGIDYLAGDQDCYGTFRSAFLGLTGELLPDFARPEMWWRDPNCDLITDNFERAEFEDTGYTANGAVPLNVLLFNVGSNKVNHIGLYLGAGLFLHHPFNRQSVIEPLSGAWKARCLKVLQHKNHQQHTQINLSVYLLGQPRHIQRKWVQR